MRCSFLYISKAFDKVWHKDLIFKIKTYDVEGNLLKLPENYLTDRRQWFVLNGQTSSWENLMQVFRKGLDYGFLYLY